MKSLWKYPLPLHTKSSIIMPLDSVILDCMSDADGPCVWALVNQDDTYVSRPFGVHAVLAQNWTTSSADVDDNPGTYVGNFNHQGILYHVFDKGPKNDNP